MFVYQGIQYNSVQEFWDAQAFFVDLVSKRKKEWRESLKEICDLPVGALALTLAMSLMKVLEKQNQPLRYSLRQYARRMLHVVTLTDDPADGVVLIEHLVEIGGEHLGQIFEELMDKVGYKEGTELPADMLAAIEKLEANRQRR